MSDDVARAVGAPASLEVTVAGKQCEIRPLRVRELAILERDCLRRYKQEVYESYKEMCDNEDDLRRKRDEISSWDIGDLPAKFAYDARRIQLSDELTDWVSRQYGIDKPGELVCRRLTAASLDAGTLSPAAYEAIVGHPPHRTAVSYVDWWVTGCYDGMSSMLWVTFKPHGITREEVQSEFDFPEMVRLTREIEKLTAPDLGNGSGSAA